MFVDGKKYACDACVRGHRVSGCNHNDRPLQEIAKKGRPVSQCQHCRSLRKSRSSHVKCDCGEKTKGAPKHHYINENGKLVELDESKGSHCQCPHGGRCTCSIKKEYLECVPETTTSTPGSSTSSEGPRVKPRLQSTQSESSLTRFTNGHHRVIHRHHSSHGSAPYHIPIHHHHTSASDSHDKITPEVDLSSSHGHIIMPSDPEDLPATYQRSNLSRQIKSETGSPSVASSGYQEGSDSTLPTNLSRTISEFNLNGSRGVFDLSLRTTDLPAFDTPDYSAREFYFSAVDSEAGLPFSAFNPPNSATWQYEASFDSFCEVPPGLTQSVSGDDSEVETWAYPTLPSPVHNITPGYLNGPFSAESSDFYESDHHDGLSTVSSRVGLANIATLPPPDLGSMENYLNTGFDGSTFNLGVQEGVSLAEIGFEGVPPTAYEDGKTISSAEIGTEHGSHLFADSEVLMMVPVTTQNVPLPPEFEAR
ncbi:hypothetical protein TWF106_003013 [Orbilia oligospora]|uniref:Copper-fist domain-containing protein n=1 Tax=Orbilia oligospora TaxID=2813651 RepID=A0A7C8QJD3_ORBOL|nr:hypothetical protein TWF788_005262 [Orbilia oligospora]KAF3215363.1 hypothetical protein TWF191_009342 [Orbilia oligospora]KAF3225135.1 hypothetical protein TWF106_003013 [Orbilia oligospora]